jgi:hypothetical protein
MYTASVDSPQRGGVALLNMNPPQMRLLFRPLTLMGLAKAAWLWRVVSVACALGCLWWLARNSGKPWSLADGAALTVWAPASSMLSTNQETWLLWPLLVTTWALWDRNRWTAGAAILGVLVSCKPFLAIYLLPLIIAQRWLATAALIAAATATSTLGILVYGTSTERAWAGALSGVSWIWAPTNVSLHGALARIFSPNPYFAPVLLRPHWVSSLWLIGAATVLAITLIRARPQKIEPVWVWTALLISPLGWLYYGWWGLSTSIRPSQLLRRSPLLAVPVWLLAKGQPNPLLTVTLGCSYLWAVGLAWWTTLPSDDSAQASVC